MDLSFTLIYQDKI